MVARGKVKRRRFHVGYVLAAIILAIVVYFGSLALFPDWNQSTSILIALAVVVIAGVVTFLADFRTAFAPTTDNPSPPPHPSTNISGSVNIDSQQTDIKGNVVGRDNIEQAGGDIVYGDKIVQQAAALEINALHQLPAPPADFTGREADLTAILNDIAQGTVISGVRGMGGIGKTALALVIADRLKAQYPDAQFIINLRGASDAPAKPYAAMSQIIRAYHPTAQLPDDATQIANLYHSVLEGQRAIVLLDDARDADQVRPLLPPKSCLVLITTRQHFHVAGLHARNLETLSPDDARELLITIAPRLNGVILSRAAAKDLFANQPEIPRFARNDTLAVVDLIAHSCGCLPLALRAAASLIAATPDLNPLTYAAQLRDERTRLTKIGREGVEIDIEASLNLSYQQLSSEAGRVFRQLSVFPATFDAAAEEAVCEDADHLHLSHLVRLSLVQYSASPPAPLSHNRTASRDYGRGGVAAPPSPESAVHSGEGGRGDEAGRYSLHDLTRLFAVALPSPVDTLFVDGGIPQGGFARAGDGGSGDLPAAQLRHAAYYKDVLAACDDLYLQGNDGILQGLTLFDREWPNIQAGQTWAVMHLKDNDAVARLCNLYPDAGTYVIDLRLHSRQQIRWLEDALTAARQLKHREAEGAHLGNLGLAYADLGETRRAIEFYEQALVVARDISDKRNEGAWLGNLGIAYFNLGETRKAIDFYEQQLVIAREIGNRRGQGNALGNLGIAYAALGETRKAIEYHEQALPIMRDIGDKRAEGQILGNLGNAYADLGETRKAIDFYEQALIIDREIGDRRGEGQDLGNLGIAYKDLGETRKAIEFYEQQLVITREIGDRSGEGNALWNMALALDKLGERVQAIAHAEAALKIYEAIEDPWAEKVRRKLAEWKSETNDQ